MGAISATGSLGGMSSLLVTLEASDDTCFQMYGFWVTRSCAMFIRSLTSGKRGLGLLTWRERKQSRLSYS